MNLENNSNEMKTVVETFVIEETAELIYDNEKLDKWNELVGDLGLSGQTKIIKPTKSPIPFMHLKTSMRNVFEVLCPRKVSVEEYDVTPIPLEILELVALSKKEGYFTSIEIWYDDKSPDPVCVGKTGNWTELTWYPGSDKTLEGKKFASKQGVIDAGGKNPFFNTENHYILGKWADVKHSFEELKEMARVRFIAQKKNELAITIRDAQRGMDDLETQAFNLFN